MLLAPRATMPVSAQLTPTRGSAGALQPLLHRYRQDGAVRLRSAVRIDREADDDAAVGRGAERELQEPRAGRTGDGVAERGRHSGVLEQSAELLDLSRGGRPAEGRELGDAVDEREPGPAHDDGAVGR